MWRDKKLAFYGLDFRQFPHTCWRRWYGLHDALPAQDISCPAHVVLPRVEKIARRFELGLMVRPNELRNLNQPRGAAAISQSVPYPVLQIVLRGHRQLPQESGIDDAERRANRPARLFAQVGLSAGLCFRANKTRPLVK